MGNKFHINEAGEAKPCKASLRSCIYGIHGDSPQEAAKIYEARMEELERSVEPGVVTMEHMDRYFDRSAGRYCGECQAHGSHHTDKHEDFARQVAFNEAVNCCGVPDCFERATCPDSTSPGHQHCGVCDDHGVPRHRCGCLGGTQPQDER